MNKSMKFLKNKEVIFLVVLLIIASFVRLFKLADYPVSLNVDEVSIGYDAFSILKTGKDHFGISFPLVFQSIGDFKNGAYIYLVAFTMAIIGVSDIAIRLPSAIFGITFVLVVYFLAKRLFKSKNIPYIFALLVTFSPWHIRLSRGGYEANVALTVLFVGILLFIKNIERKKSPIVSLILIIFSAYIYHSEKILAPILIIFLYFIYRNKIGFRLKKLVINIFVLALVSLPLLSTMFGQNRSSAVLASKDPEILLISNESINFSAFKNNYLMVYSSVRRYFQFFDPSFLFIEGLEFTQHTNLNQGLFYLIETPFFFFGLYIFIRQKSSIFKNKEAFYIYCLVLLISALPAAITLNDYHIIRPYTLIFPFLGFIAIGLSYLPPKPQYIVVLVSLYFLSFITFVDYYAIHFTKERDEWIFYPSKQVAMTVLENLDKYDQIIVDPYFGKLGPYTRGIPDIYVLYYGEINPTFLWQNIPSNIDKIKYRHIEWELDKKLKNTLLIGSPWSLPQKEIKPELIKNILLFNDGRKAYLIVNNDSEEK